MPTYQYTCTDCGQPLEAVQSFSDDALTECPACGGRLRKVFSAVGVVFKGSGFYRTDSRSGSSSGSSNGSSSSNGSGNGSGDSKAATSTSSGDGKTATTTAASTSTTSKSTSAA